MPPPTGRPLLRATGVCCLWLAVCLIWMVGDASAQSSTVAQTAATPGTATAAPTPSVPDAQALAAMPRTERVVRLRTRSWDVHAVRSTTPILLDGALTEAAWSAASPITDFYQNQRNEGLPATERTAVRVVYTQEALYVGVRAWDSEPDRMKIRAVFRDDSGGADDTVSIMLDAYHGHRSAIQFITNANGLVEDLLQTGEGLNTRNHDWDAIWNAQGRRLDDGFEVEVAIPFRSLRFEPPAGEAPIVFGIGFKRNIPRKNEEVYWPFVPNDSSWYRPSELGHLHGLDGLRPGRNLQVLPYALGGGIRSMPDGQPASSSTRRTLGLDAKWGVTTGLTADFTVNTDFAQEEVDVQQVNLTRFSLFFPEKRQFFLEGQQAFRFGVPREADLVFTRRIGLSAAGEPIPILGGARLSGRQGRHSIGLMSLQVDGTATTPSKNYSVLRLKRDVLSRSSIGMVATDVEGGGAGNRLLGVDASLFVRRVWFFEGWAAGVDDWQRGRAAAGYARAAYESDRRAASYTFLGVGQGFRPEVGFIRRPDSLQHAGEARWSPRPQSAVVRQLHLTGSVLHITDTARRPVTRETALKARSEFESGDALQVVTTAYQEDLAAPFALRPTLTLPAGTYRFRDVALTADSFRRRQVQLDGTYTAGTFYGGTRRALQLNYNWRFMRGVNTTASYTANWVRLPQSRFSTHLVSARLALAPRNDLAVQSLFQFNADTKQVSTNLRLNWIPKPGTDVFLVYTEVDSTAFGWLTPRNRSLTLKWNYLFQL